MNGLTLKALRSFLFFTAPEAARMIGFVQERSWRRWEAGGAPVPTDVKVGIRALIISREMLLKQYISDIKKAGDKPVSLTFYTSIDHWLDAPVMWRIHCSVMAELAANLKNIELLGFDFVSYKKWLGNKDDNKINRAAWSTASKLSPIPAINRTIRITTGSL